MTEPESKKLWDALLKRNNLERGYHLARQDFKKAFMEDLYMIEAFASDYNNNIAEIKRQLSKGTYHPKPLARIDIPKNPLSVRPGSVLCFEDGIVLFAIVFLIAEKIYVNMSPNVYSYQLKKGYKNQKNKDYLFAESASFLDSAHLPKKTVLRQVDPFESWYELWPKFDEESKKAYQKRGHKYLAISDIAAYFENIQIPILRDQLLTGELHDEAKLVNLLISFFEDWATKTTDGRAQWRGIPQGNSVSSFLGNIFLMKLDVAFENFAKQAGEGEVEYHRYMDDIRIFTKKEETARAAILLLEKELRDLHLNVQTAKTVILVEDGTRKEITEKLTDARLDALNAEIDTIRKLGILTKKDREKYHKKIKTIISAKPASRDRQKITGPKKKPLSGLDSRLFRRWAHVSLHYLGKKDFIDRLNFEIQSGPDSRMTAIAAQVIKRFPDSIDSVRFANSLFSYVKSKLSIFPHQTAELLRSFRYLSEIPPEIITYCKTKALDKNSDSYIRVQAIYLLGRTELTDQDFKLFEAAFSQEQEENVLIALSSLLILNKKKNGDILTMLMYHPNSKISSVGKYFRSLKWDAKSATSKVTFIFNKDYEVSIKLCDTLPLLYLVAYATKNDMQPVRELLKNKIGEVKDNINRKGLRPILNNLYSDLDIELKLFKLNSITTEKKVATPDELVGSVKDEDF